MAFDTEIQALAGTATQTEMDQWKNDGAREVMNLLPPHLKEYCYSKQTFTSAAANSEAETMITGQLGSVYAGSVECRQIRPMDKHKASDSNSLEKASSTDPVYYVEGNKINILPASSSGVYYVIPNPSINASDVSTIDNFPNEAEYLVVLYAAIKVLQNKMNEKSRSDLSLDFAIPPIPPTPSFTTPTIGDVTISPTLLMNLGTPPVYNSQIVSPDFGDANTWLNTEEDSEMVASRVHIIQSQIQDFQAKIQNELNVFNKENTEYQTKLQEAVQQAQLDSQKASQQAQLDSQDAQQEASLLLQKETQEYANKLQKYSSEVSGYQAEVSKKVQEFQQNFQKDSQEYQWLQSQQAKLQQDYNQGIQLLIGGGAPQQQQGER